MGMVAKCVSAILNWRNGFDLQPRPERNRRPPGDANDDRVARADPQEIARGQVAMRGKEFHRAQEQPREQIGMGDDAAGAGGDGEAGQQAATTVAHHDGMSCRVITRMASVAHVMAAAKGTSMGVKNRLP